MGLFQRENSKYWYARYKSPAGKWITKSTGTDNKKLAKEILTKWEYDATQAFKTGRMELPELSFIDFREDYLSHRRNTKKSGTVNLDALALNDLLECINPATLLHEISVQDIENVLQSLQAKNLSPYTIRQRLTHVKRAFNWAIENDLLYMNPVKKVKAPSLPQQTIHEIPRQDMRALLETSNDSWIGDYIAAAAYGGFRSSEITRIKEDDIHWEENYVLVTGKFDKQRAVPLFPSLQDLFHKILKYDNSNDPRITPWFNGNKEPYLFYQVSHCSLVSQAFKSMVRSIWSRDVYKVISDYIIRDDGQKFQQNENFSPSSTERKRLRGKIKKVSKRHHLEKDRYRFHDLRHRFATNYLRNGGSIEKLRKILGHRQISTTLKYEHLVVNDLQENEDPVQY